MPQPQRRNNKAAGVHVPLRLSVVRLAICGSAAVSAAAPEAPIWLSASRAKPHCPSNPTACRPQPTVRPHAEAHCAHYRRKQAMPQPQRRNNKAAGVHVHMRSSVVRLAICGSAAASAAAPSAPILFPASRAKPHCPSNPTARRPQPTERPHAEAHCAPYRLKLMMPQPQRRNNKAAGVHVPSRWSVVRLAICGSAVASAAAPEAPIWLSVSRAKPHCPSNPTARRPQPTERPHAEAHCAHYRRKQAMPQPRRRNNKAAGVNVLPRSSVVRLAICGSAAVSATKPEPPIPITASHASLTAPPTLLPAEHSRPCARNPRHTARTTA
jgi:hypothetical protein